MRSTRSDWEGHHQPGRVSQSGSPSIVVIARRIVRWLTPPRTVATLPRMTFNLVPTRMRTLPKYRIRQSTRARHVNLKICPVDGLVVVVPRDFDEQLIPALIYQQRRWIESQFEKFRHATMPAECWQRPVLVALPAARANWAIEYRATRSTAVRITTENNGSLLATGAVDHETTLRKALRRWLKRRAQHLLPLRLNELAETHGFNFARVTIRHQRSRWGSCSSSGTISLNAKLMFVAPILVDHVLLHELCHTIHPHHGASFQELLTELVPNHRHQRVALREAWAAIPSWAHR